MRRITMVALVTVLALVGAACGGDDDDATTEDTEASDDGGTTDDDGGDEGATTDLGDIVDDDCEFLLAGAFLNPLGAVASGQAGDLEDSNERIEAIAEAAPDEIADAMETINEAWAEMIAAFKDVDLSNPQAFADADVQAKLEDLQDVFDDDYEQATQELSDYVDENCTGAASN